MTIAATDIPATVKPPAGSDRPLNVAMLLSCDTFESFFGDVLKLDRDRYLTSYRNDWSWYYAAGMRDNGLRPTIYLPSVKYAGRHETDTGIGVRFLPTAGWYRPLAKLRRACRATRWSLYVQERVNAAAFFPALQSALVEDGIGLLYTQEYWGGRFDHLAAHVRLPLAAQDHGGLHTGVVTAAKRWSLPRAALLLSQTPDECRHVERFGGRPTLHPNGCDTSFFCPPARPATKTQTILTVARLTDKQKRTSDLIRALPLLEADWTLDIVGTGPDRAALESLAARLGVADRVRFRGFQGRAEVRDFCRTCGVFAMPSSNEGLSVAMIEAMACGAAPVATRIRSFEQVIDDGVTGILVPVGDVPALADAIARVWDRRETLGPAAAAVAAQRYDTRVLYRQLAERLRAAAASGVAT